MGWFGGQAVNGETKFEGKTACWRVVVIAGSVINSEGIAAILGRDSRFDVSAAIHDLRTAENSVTSCRPDLVLIEPPVDRIEGFNLVKKIAAQLPSTRIIVISERRERVFAECAFRAGASAYFVKSGTADALLGSVALVASSGQADAPNSRLPAVPQLLDPGMMSDSDLKDLSARELEVFSLIAAGRGTGQITEDLGVSRKTVETHCEHIKLKLGFQDANELKKGARQLLARIGEPNNAKSRK
jgi:DNA-binding NarL/FixJ family response regulator